MLPIAWLVLGIATFVAAVRAARSTRALRVGRLAAGLLDIGGGALVNAVFLADGENYAGFAKARILPLCGAPGVRWSSRTTTSSSRC